MNTLSGPAMAAVGAFRKARYTLMPLQPGTKIPRDRGWRSRDYSDFDADEWLRDGGNVGIRLAADDLVIDVDPRHDGDHSLNVLSFDVDADLDHAPTNVTGRGDGGRHLFFKKPADVPIIAKHPRLPGLDFKTVGGYVVAPGSVHPESGGVYEIDVLEWTGIEHVALAPAELLEVLRRPAVPERTGEGGELTCEELELVLSGLRSEDYGQAGKHHDQWLAIAAAAHDATDGHGLEEWLAWCERDEQYGPDARELNTRRWNSLTAGKPGGVTYKTLLKAVSDAGRPDILASLRTPAAADFDDFEEEDAPPAKARTVGGLTYQRADEVEQQNITWLWPYRIAIGKLTGIAGPPDQGKSQLTAAISATVTTGATWPDVGQAPLGAVAMLSAEDDASDTIAPRLEAAGADMSKVFLVNMLVRRDKGGKSMFNLAEDISQLTALVTEHPEINLVIIDPISAYMGSSKSVDTFRNSDVRGVLAPLGEWASKRGVAVVFVTHFSKSGTGSAINRVMDSLAFTALARSFWVVVPEISEKTQSETGRKLLLKGKQNIAQPTGGLAYRIEGVTLANGVQTSHIVWDDQVDLTGDDVLLRERTTSGSPKLDAAKAFLIRILKDGQMNTKDIEAAAKVEGHAWATVRRAKEELPIGAYQGGSGWSWELEGTETE